MVYDYGSRVVYEGDRSTTTASGRHGRAVRHAGDEHRHGGVEAAPPEKEAWESLGVFAMVQGEEKEANHIFQIAINHDR